MVIIFKFRLSKNNPNSLSNEILVSSLIFFNFLFIFLFTMKGIMNQRIKITIIVPTIIIVRAGQYLIIQLLKSLKVTINNYFSLFSKF